MPALAGEGKRICGANRNGDSHYETVTLVEHGSGIPNASCSFHNANEELNATRQLLTLDALHASFESVGLIVEAQADYMLTPQGQHRLAVGQGKINDVIYVFMLYAT